MTDRYRVNQRPPGWHGLLRSRKRLSKVTKTGVVAVSGLGLAVAGINASPPAVAAPPAKRPPAAPVNGGAAHGGSVVVLLKNQHAKINLRTHAKKRKAKVRADQAPITSSIKSSGGTHITHLVAPNAVAAHVSAAEVAKLRHNSSVAKIVPDAKVHMNPPRSAQTSHSRPAPHKGTKPAPKKPAKPSPQKTTTCPFNPAGPRKPLQEPEAAADVHASNGNPHAPKMANSIATGKHVIVANQGINALAGNPNFTRPDGSHVVIDAPDYTADHGNSETYGDASSIAAQATVTYQYSKALPFSPVPKGCSFIIKGVAPGASLVDLTQVDTPILPMSKVLGGIDRMVSTVHADVISESFGTSSLPNTFGQLLTTANEAAVQAGVTVVESSGDSGSSGTVISAADDPSVIAAGAVNNFRLVAINNGFSKYKSNEMAALSSGGTAPTNKVVNLVAPGWYGGEAACAAGVGGCPPNYPTESMRGTSEAAPLIAGAAADVIQAYRETHHGASPTPQVVRRLLTSTASDLDNAADQQGDGLLNIYRAVKAAQQMPGSTLSTGPGNTPSLVASPWQLNLSGHGGSVSDQSVRVYNTSDSPTTVTSRYRKLGLKHRIGKVAHRRITAPDPAKPIPPQGATAAKSAKFRVPAGVDMLNGDMIWPDKTNSNILQVQLFNPQGKLVQESFDDPDGGHEYGVPTSSVPDIQHVTVANPMPGKWTAKFLWAGLDVDLAHGPATPGNYRGPMSFKVTRQSFHTKHAAAPVKISGHGTATIPLRITMPQKPGDHPESVQLSAGNGAKTSLPVTRRTVIPSNGGAFTTRITSSVGRSVGQISTYQINLPASRQYLDAKFHAPNAARNNSFTFYLVNPSGDVVTTATAGPNKNAELYTHHPVSGSWQIDVVLDLTTNGKKYTQTVHGTVAAPAGAPWESRWRHPGKQRP